MNQHICPSCKGEPAKPVLALFNTGEDWTKHYAKEVVMPCRVCGNTGAVSDAVNRRWYAGRLHRHMRAQRGETLFHAAKRLGVTSPQLSAYELGYADLPSTTEHDLPAGSHQAPER